MFPRLGDRFAALLNVPSSKEEEWHPRRAISILYDTLLSLPAYGRGSVHLAIPMQSSTSYTAITPTGLETLLQFEQQTRSYILCYLFGY